MSDTDDPTKVIDFAKKRSAKHGKKRDQGKSAAHARRYAEMLQKAARDMATAEAEALSPAEGDFVDLVLAGESLSEAFSGAFPDQSRNAQGEQLSPSRLYDKGRRLSETMRVRAEMRLRLEREMGEFENTARRLHNFALKRLEHEAVYSTPAGRLKALAMLRDFGAIGAIDREAEQRTKAGSDELIAQIAAKLEKLDKLSG